MKDSPTGKHDSLGFGARIGAFKMNETPPITEDLNKLMIRYGITRVPADQFHYKNYRYSNLRDAIAQARRDDHTDGL